MSSVSAPAKPLPPLTGEWTGCDHRRVSRDLRICFVGDSFVAGVGDPTALGWTGRLAAHAAAAGQEPTVYNLGVRHQTSTDIADRWRAECEPRLPAGTDARVVFSFGVNDTMAEHGRPRVDSDTSVAHLIDFLDTARGRGWPALVVAPPPIDDPAHNLRTAELDERFARVCAAARVPYAATHRTLAGDETWCAEVRAGDGAHPAARGYAVFADSVLLVWRDWLGY